MAGIDWEKVKRGKQTETTVAPPQLGSGAGRITSTTVPLPTVRQPGNIDWSKVKGGSGDSSSGKGDGGKKSKSILSRIASDVKGAVTGVPLGLVHMGRDTGESLYNTARTVGAMAHVIGEPSDLKVQKGEGFADYVTRKFPILSDLAQPTVNAVRDIGGLAQMANVAPGEGLAEQTKERWSQHPAGSALEDVAGAAIVLAPVAKLASGVAEGAEAGSAASRVASGTAKAARATEKAASLPAKPFEVAARGLGKVGSAAYSRAAESEGRTGQSLRALKLDPESRALRRDVLQPASEQVSEATGRQVALGQRLAKLLPDEVEQKAAVLVGEHEAPALAAARAHLSPDRFAALVEAKYGQAVPVEAVHLAADIVDGKVPEVAARVDEALKVGHEAPGGRAERAVDYLAEKPDREWQAGFDPNPEVIDAAVEKASQHLPKAAKTAKVLRARADAAAEAYNATKDAPSNGAANVEHYHFTTPEGAAEIRAKGFAAGGGGYGSGVYVAAPSPINRDTWRGIVRDKIADAGKTGEPVDLPVKLNITKVFDHEPLSDMHRPLRDVLARSEPSLVKHFDRYIRDNPRRATSNMHAFRYALEQGGYDALRVTEDSGLSQLIVFDPAKVALSTPGVPSFAQGKKLGRLESRASAAQSLANRSEAVLGRMRERVKTEAAKAANTVEAAPARLRPVLQTNREVSTVLAEHERELRAGGDAASADLVKKAADELPTTLKALRDSGVDPDHFIHVQIGDRPTAGGIKSGKSLPNVRKARSERQRSTAAGYDRTVRAQAQGEIDELRNAVARQAAAKVAAMPFAAKLDTGAAEGITLSMGQSEIKRALSERKLAAWDPRSPFETPGTITKDTVLIPEHIKDGFRSYFVDPAAEKVLRLTYDPAVGLFKTGVLALSPSWHIGNVVGNLALGTLGAGVDPITLAAKIGQAVKEYHASGPHGERTWEGVAPRRLMTAGPTHEELRFLRETETAAGDTKVGRAALAVSSPLRVLAHKSYALNEFVDNIGRSAVYLAKKDAGMAPELAVKESLKAMGDFSRMTPAERRIVRRVIPFYAWQRHITQLAFRLPVEHPIRVAWVLHLGDQAIRETDTEGLPDYLRGAIPVGHGRVLEAGRFFPFGDAGRILEPAGIASSMSPVIKLGMQNVPGLPGNGVNLMKGKPFTRPPGTGRTDEFGNPMPTAPSLAKQTTDLFPQKRLLEAVTGRNQVARYDTGDKVLTKRGPIETGKSTKLGLLRFLGVPLDDQEQTAEMAKRIAEKETANAKARASYEKRRKKG